MIPLPPDDILTNLRWLSQGCTTCLITHDPGLAAACDLIVYIDRGRMVESGAPRELNQGNGRYAALDRLYSLQVALGGHDIHEEGSLALAR